ncbi:MAG: hypothetical protein V1794_12535 [Candidatus Glassbacteria bacterium]
MDIIIIIIGIVLLVQKSKVRAMLPNAFPGIQDDEFARWKQLELHRFNVLLGIVWIWIGFVIVVITPLFVITRNESLLILEFISLPVLIAVFVASRVTRKEAERMKKSFTEKSSHASQLPQ